MMQYAPVVEMLDESHGEYMDKTT